MSARRPPGRLASLLGVLVVGLALVGIVQAANLLRHPMPDGLPPVPELDDPSADPRREVVCEDPRPIEGEERDEDAEEQGPPVVITSNELLDCPQTYHRRTVRYRGEVVAGVLGRRDGAWAHLNDDVYARDERGPLPTHRDYAGGNAGIGVLLPLDVADEIERVGGPQQRGDIVEVVGEFRRVDPERREVAVIVAAEARIVQAGRPIEDPVLPERPIVAALLALLAVAVAVTERVVAARRS